MTKEILIHNSDIKELLNPLKIKFWNGGYGRRIVFETDDVSLYIDSYDLSEKINEKITYKSDGIVIKKENDNDLRKNKIEIKSEFFQKIIKLLKEVLI